MAKKPSSKSARSNVTIHGDVHAGRDVVMGDQYNDLRQQIAQIASPADFVAKAREVQSELVRLKTQPEITPSEKRRLEAVEGDVADVIEEALKPKPLPERINGTLTAATQTLENMSKSVAAAVGLGTLLGTLGQAALKLFGG